jgi:hypothetical protein
VQHHTVAFQGEYFLQIKVSEDEARELWMCMDYSAGAPLELEQALFRFLRERGRD